MSQQGQTSGQSRSFGAKKNLGNTKFFDSNTAQQEQQKQDEIKQQVKQDTSASTAPDVVAKNKKNRPKVDSVIASGKQFAESFFRGFITKHRANVKVDVQSGLVSRLAEPYGLRLRKVSNDMFESNPEREKLYDRFLGITHFAMAAKLKVSAQEEEHDRLVQFYCLDSKELEMPKKLTVLIDQVGKTDLPGENKLRIRSQHLVAKKHLLAAIAHFYRKDELTKPRIPYVNGISNEKVLEWLSDEEIWDNLYDQHSLAIAKKRAKDRFKQLSSKDNLKIRVFNAEKEPVEIYLRLPNLVYQGPEPEVSDIKDYLANPLLSYFEGQDESLHLVASLVLLVATKSWLKKKDKTMGAIHDGFKGTFLQNYKLRDVLQWMHMYDLSDIISDEDLQIWGSALVKKHQKVLLPYYKQHFDMIQVKFNDHGGDCQAIEHISGLRYEEGEWERPVTVVPERPATQTRFRISPHGAVLGWAFSFVKNMEMRVGSELAVDSSSTNVALQFIKSDFISK